MKQLKITTSEIAKICKVSQGTVDRALNNRTGIRAETKHKILEVAQSYGYREKIDGNNDEIKGQIGIVVFNLNNEYFSNLITELEYVLNEQKLSAVVMFSHYDKKREIECILNLYNMGVEAIILCPVNSGTEFNNYLSLMDIPIICVGNRISSLPYVGVDDFEAMRDMTLHCISRGINNIVYFSPALQYPDSFAQRLRYEGFLSAVGSVKYKVLTNEDELEVYQGDGTAVICSNDYYALNAYFKGIKAKITGFDNIKTISKYKLPIDTVDYSAWEVARCVTDIITGKSKSSKIIEHKIILNQK